MTLARFGNNYWSYATVRASDIPENFWRHVNKTPTCWLWTGATAGIGYGQFSMNGRQFRAHRVALFGIANYSTKDFALHKCDVPLCVNPAHLFAGTQADNVRDCVEKGRRRNVKGEMHPFSKLTEEVVIQLRERYARLPKTAGGFSPRHSVAALAQEFQIPYLNAKNVIQRKTWKHI